MKSSFKPIIVSLFFAALLILSSLLLKGKTAGDWVDGIIYMAWAYFFYRSFTTKKAYSIRLAKSQRPVCVRNE